MRLFEKQLREDKRDIKRDDKRRYCSRAEKYDYEFEGTASRGDAYVERGGE